MLVRIDGGNLACIERDAATGIIPNIERRMRVGVCPLAFCKMSIVSSRPVDEGCAGVANNARLYSYEALDRAFNGVDVDSCRRFLADQPGSAGTATAVELRRPE